MGEEARPKSMTEEDQHVRGQTGRAAPSGESGPVGTGGGNVRSGLFFRRPNWVTRDLLSISFSMFFAAMGANAFNQYVIPYLTGVRHWEVGKATLTMAATFAFIPLIRFNYPRVHRWLGDRGSLVVGNILFLLYMILMVYGEGPLAPIAISATLAIAVGLVFMAAPLQIYDATPVDRMGKASGFFLTSTFAAWFAGILLYSMVIRHIGFEAIPYAAMFVSALGLVSLSLVPRRKTIRPLQPVRIILSRLKNPRLRIVLFFMALSAFSIGLMFGPFAQFMANTYGPATTSILVLGFYLARLPGSLGTGLVADRWGLMPILVGASVMTGLILIIAGVSQTILAFLAAIIVLGLHQSAVPVAAMTLVGNVAELGARHQTLAYIFAASELSIGISLLISFVLSGSFSDLGLVFPIFGVFYLASAAIAYRWLQSDRLTLAPFIGG